MSERPEADKPAQTAPPLKTTEQTPKPPPKHPTTYSPPAKGTPPKKGDSPEKAFPWGFVEHPDGYMIGQHADGTKYIRNPDGSYASWDPDAGVWRDPETGEAKPPEWSAGHGGQVELGIVKGGYLSETPNQPKP